MTDTQDTDVIQVSILLVYCINNVLRIEYLYLPTSVCIHQPGVPVQVPMETHDQGHRECVQYVLRATGTLSEGSH